jgi:hypothetical protein
MAGHCFTRRPRSCADALVDTRPTRVRRRRSTHEYMRQLGWRTLWLIAKHSLGVWVMPAVVRGGTLALPLHGDIPKAARFSPGSAEKFQGNA